MDRTQAIEILAAFCGPRDLPSLTTQALRAEQGLEQVDVLVFFGGRDFQPVFGKEVRPVR